MVRVDGDGNRRRASRIPLHMLVTYWVDVHGRTESYTVEAINLSTEGMFIQLETPLALGTKVLLRFRLPGTERDLSVEGEVAWVRSECGADQSLSGKGIRFSDVEDKARILLKSYIELQG